MDISRLLACIACFPIRLVWSFPLNIMVQNVQRLCQASGALLEQFSKVAEYV